MTTPEPAPDTRPTSSGPHAGSRFRWWWRPPAFVVGFAAILAALYLAGRDIYLDPGVAADREALRKMHTGRVILLGTSHGHDLSLSDAGFDGVDLSHGGEDLFESAYMARSVKRWARHLDTVIISLSYFSFVFDNAAYIEEGVQTRVGRRIDLYAGYGRLGFIPGDGAEYLKGLLYPVVTTDHYRAGFEGLGALLRRGTTNPNARAADPDTPEPAKRQPDAWYAKQAKGRCKLFGGYARNMSQHHPGLAEDSFESTVELTRELRAASIRVIFFTPPYLRPYNACFNQDYQKQTRANGRRLASISGTLYFDFSHDPGFVDNTAFFDDSDHMSAEGKLAFSRLFKQELDTRSR